MAKIKTRKSGSAKVALSLPFTKKNYIIFAISVAVILIGYIALAQGPAESYWSLTVGPVLLVIGYCILVPLAILYRDEDTAKNPS
ncbi:MAG TPA: hypothetical protein ENJ29_11320 [Bacteroidetes bacterium]|nr:hypothetical protein [Bacteroidota bacterium]